MFNWFRRPEPDPLLLQLMETLRQQSEAQTKLMEKVLEQSAAQAAQSQQMVQGMLDLWKPTREPSATTLHERELAKEASELWDPIADNVFAQLDADLGIPAEFLR